MIITAFKYIRVYKWFLCVICFLVYSLFLSFLPKKPFEGRNGLLVLDRNKDVLRAFLNPYDQWQFIDETDSIPEKLKKSIILYEDVYFYYHLGFNPISIAKAAVDNIMSGHIKRGASTLTMQVARLLEPKPRTFFNKYKEICQAINFEFLYTKDEILNYYCNNAPYGKNIVGYQAASLFYFNKFPKQLSWAESALLAVLPNAPGMMHPSKNTELLRNKRNSLLKKLYLKGTINKQTYELACLETITKTIFYPEKYALHFSERIRHIGKTGILKTTLDKRMQKEAEHLVSEASLSAKMQGIQNASALVVDTKTAEIRAYVGSQDYWDSTHQGMVDGVVAKRSSGSILKPFLYALAIDRGDLIPETFVKDIPSHYQGFSPNNANEKFSGYATMQDALIRSLNVPAVRVLFQYGTYSFYRNLQEMGVSSLFRTSDEYGLSLILGGAEVTLWDMVGLYASLGRYGNFADVSYLSDTPEFKTIISPMASWQILDVMKNVKRPGAEYYWDQYESGKPIAWKTGTSYGQKDAWAIGTSSSLTIGVWMGNFTGEGNPNLAGAKTAGPLLFDLYNRLDTDRTESWFIKPEYNATEIEICTESGFRASAICPKKTIQSATSIRPLNECKWHQKLFLSFDEKETVCSLCWQSGYREKIKLIPPPDVTLQLKKSGKYYTQKPPHRSSCESIRYNIMSIEYPEKNSVLAIPVEYHGEKMRILSSVSHELKNIKLYWYLNNEYLGTTSENKYAFECLPGKYVLKVIDENGNSVRQKFQILERK